MQARDRLVSIRCESRKTAQTTKKKFNKLQIQHRDYFTLEITQWEQQRKDGFGKKSSLALFKLLSQHSPGMTKGDQAKPQREWVVDDGSSHEQVKPKVYERSYGPSWNISVYYIFHHNKSSTKEVNRKKIYLLIMFSSCPPPKRNQVPISLRLLTTYIWFNYDVL